MTGGIFSADSRFGTIELSHFSCFAIVLNRMCSGIWGGGRGGESVGMREIEEGREMERVGENEGERDIVGEGEQEAGKAVQKGGVEGGQGVEGIRERDDGKTTAEKQYAALTYYIPQLSRTTWLVHLPIIWDLDLCMKVL